MTSLFSRVRASWPILLLWSGLFVVSLLLPSLNGGIFASPDETAVAVSIEQIYDTGSAAVSEPLAEEAPWLHPRSYVASGEKIVPVGFLGWPWWLAQLRRFVPAVALPWLASLIAASGSIPWYLLLRKKFARSTAWWGTALAWLFPTTLLYVNRSYFSHVPQYALVLWSFWVLIQAETELFARAEQSVHLKKLLGGVLLGIACSFRPLEAVWILPLYLWTWSRFVLVQKKALITVLGGVCVGVFPLAWVQAKTYGHWFHMGYWTASNPDPSQRLLALGVPAQTHAWYLRIAPYGIHPRNVLWNVRAFFVGYLAPWVWAAAALVLYHLGHRWVARKQKEVGDAWKSTLMMGCVLGWSALWLLLVYGSGLYADHVRPGAVTAANSFLRYTLPGGFLWAWIVAYTGERLKARKQNVGIFVFHVCACAVMMYGLYTAFGRDEEGIFATRRELASYQEIRAAAQEAFQPTDVILSERSDKVFFPIFRAATPLPRREQLATLSSVASSTGIGLFHRPLSFTERDEWRKMGYDVREVRAFARERLYRLTPFLR